MFCDVCIFWRFVDCRFLNCWLLERIGFTLMVRLLFFMVHRWGVLIACHLSLILTAECFLELVVHGNG